MALNESPSAGAINHLSDHAALRVDYLSRGTDRTLPVFTGSDAGVNGSYYGPTHDVIHAALHAEYNALGGATALPTSPTAGNTGHLAHHAALHQAYNLRQSVPINYNLGVAIPAYSGKSLLFGGATYMQSVIDAAVAMGCGWLRTDVVAQQATGATLGIYDWSAWEATFTYAKSKNMLILACISGQVTSDGAAPSVPNTATARSHMADFAVAFVNHFAAGTAYAVDGVELYNEVNTQRFWPTPSMAAYGALIAVMYPALKAANPNLPVISGGTGGTGASANDITTLTWYQQFYAGGFNAYCDAVAIHPYSNFTTTPGKNEEAYTSQIRALMVANGDGYKALIATETGAPTGGSYGVSEADQATIISNSWTHFRANAGNPGPLFLYTVDDFATAGSSTDAENYFGIRRYDATLKPAYAAVRSLT